MTTYHELMQQAKALMAQAEKARKAEVAGVIADIKATMKEHGISLADLGGSPSKKKASGGAEKAAKFRGPNGELWSGGPGRQPGWVREIVAAGGDIEKYRI